MGKKRRLLAAKGKFGNKFSAHPRYKVTDVVPTLKASDDLKVIAKKIETIETEVLKTEDEIKKVVIETTPVSTPTPAVTKTAAEPTPTQAAKSTIVEKKAPTKKKATANTTKRKSTTKRKTTSTTAKNQLLFIDWL